MAGHSAILFSYFFKRSSIASSISRDLGILVSSANRLKSFINSFFKEEVNLVRFTNSASATASTTLHHFTLNSVSSATAKNKWLHFALYGVS